MLLNKPLSFAKNRLAGSLSHAATASELAGKHLERGRGSWLARYGYLLAAEFDLANPSLRSSWGGPFNGQINRVKIFDAILAACNISIIVETGTFRATTTEYMATNFSGKIYTCELSRRHFEYAKRRLKDFANVEVQLTDSRRFLEQLFSRGLLEGKSVFFYLDAHWNADLPLLGEISLILNRHPSAVVMIDDFEVPFDQDYGYDNYGPGNKLCLGMFKGLRNQMEYSYFPALPGSKETGVRRGCIVFATSAELDQRLGTLSNLRRATPHNWSLYGL